MEKHDDSLAKALCNYRRRCILEALYDEAMTFSELKWATGFRDKNLDHHLKGLIGVGLVEKLNRSEYPEPSRVGGYVIRKNLVPKIKNFYTILDEIESSMKRG